MKNISLVNIFVASAGSHELGRFDSALEAASCIASIVETEIDDAIFALDDVKNDSIEGYDQAAYDRHYQDTIKRIADSADCSWAYEDGNGKRFVIKTEKAVRTTIGEGITAYHNDESLSDIVYSLRSDVRVTEDLGTDCDAWASDEDDDAVENSARLAGFDDVNSISWSSICVSSDDAQEALDDIDAILDHNPGPFPGAEKILREAREKIALLA